MMTQLPFSTRGSVSILDRMKSRRTRRIVVLLLLLFVGVVGVGVGLVLREHSVVELKDARVEYWAQRHGFVERVVDTPQAHVRYWIGGEGPPVLLVHGWASYGTWNWFAQMKGLEGFRLIIPDLPGFGESHFKEGATPGLDSEAEALRQVIADAGFDQVDLVASSYGGFVAFTLVSQSPELVDKLVIIDSPGPPYTHEDLQGMLARLDVDDTEELFIPNEPADLRTLLGAASRVPPRLVPRFMLTDLYQDLIIPQEDTKEVLVHELESHQSLPEPLLPGRDVLVIWGAWDGLFPVEVGERLAQDLGARFVLVPRASHRPHSERPRVVNRELREFLSQDLTARGSPAPGSH